jgi:signal transduction histidine kinase
MGPTGTTSSTTDDDVGVPSGSGPPLLPLTTEVLDHAGIRQDLVRAAILRVAGAIVPSGARATSAQRAAVGELLRIGHFLEGPTSSPEQGDSLQVRLLDRRLADALRDDLVENSMRVAPEHAGGVLAILRRLRELQQGVLPGDDADLGARLSEPDAFDLIVEVAHDLRSPLTSVLFLAETLRAGHSGPTNDLQRNQLGLIYSAALGMVSIASDVMEMARGGSRLSDEGPVPFTVTEIFETVEEVVRPMADVKGIELRFRPPLEDRRLGHPLPLSRILLNLTTNALKFTDTGFVEISAEALGSADVLFSVRDTGRGIDPRNQETLYAPFKKSEHRSGHFFSGSGLGLSIARRLAEALGGELQFETGTDWGTRFFFRLSLPPSSS